MHVLSSLSNAQRLLYKHQRRIQSQGRVAKSQFFCIGLGSILRQRSFKATPLKAKIGKLSKSDISITDVHLTLVCTFLPLRTNVTIVRTSLRRTTKRLLKVVALRAETQAALKNRSNANEDLPGNSVVSAGHDSAIETACHDSANDTACKEAEVNKMSRCYDSSAGAVCALEISKSLTKSSVNPMITFVFQLQAPSITFRHGPLAGSVHALFINVTLPRLVRDQQLSCSLQRLLCLSALFTGSQSDTQQWRVVQAGD